MLRYVIAVEGVENDQVILEGVGQGSFGKYSAVLIENFNLVVLFEVEVFFCDLGNGGICLLYTSPSPRDAHESRMPSSA